MSKLLFCKLKDEKDTIKNEAYQFQIGTKEKPKEVFKRIDAIYQKAKQEAEDIFKEDINLPPEIVFSCIKHLQDLAINNIDLDTKGIAFENFMQDFFKGKMGQYFTPRNVVKFAVDMIQPKSEMRVLDPACGSGGFLLNAIDYVRAYAEENYTDLLEIYNHWHNFAKDRIFGIEINDQIARVCKMNMILHDAGQNNFISTDSLDTVNRFLNKKFKKNYFDLILTHPPFGARIQSTEKQYLKSYRLGNYKNKPIKSQKIEILFIERCLEFLKPETGKMAIVLPDGILNNKSLQYVRDYIMGTCQIVAIISLPEMTFRHYGAGVKASLLFVRKKRENEILKNAPIFMAIAEHVGYDATGRETPDKNDFPKILKQYRIFQQTQGVMLASRAEASDALQNKIFLINRDKLEARMDSHFYKPEFIKNLYKVQNIHNKQLGELISFSNETWNRTQQDFFTNKFPYIEINGVDLETGDINKISEIPISEAPSRAKMIVRENDIILSTTRPSQGAICLIDKHFDGFIASTGFAIIRKLKVEFLDRNYLFYALRFDSTLKQFEQWSTGGNYPSITKNELQNILLPLPPKETQTLIITFMDHAYALKKQNETEAAQLLSSIDDFVMLQLGIALPEVKKVFRLMSKDIQGKRFDVKFYQFNIFEFRNQLKNPITINELIVDYKKGIEVGSSNYVNKGIPFIRVSDINDNDLNLKQTNKKIHESLFKELKENFCPKKGELLYTIVGTIGLSYVITQQENSIVSRAFLRLICKDLESAKFLNIILSLKVYREIVNIKSSGSVLQNLDFKEFLNIPIPFPEKQKRDRIVNKVDEIKAKVKSLKKEAAQVVEKAKQEVEDILFKT